MIEFDASKFNGNDTIKNDSLEVSPKTIRSPEAVKKAMSLLQHMDRTEWELRDKLHKNGFEQDEIEEAIQYVSSYHYLDDERYARRFMEIYKEERSICRMKQDLKKRHVPEEYITLAIENIEGDDRGAFEKAARKVIKDQELSELSYAERQKLAAKLFRKGFTMSQIREKFQL